MSDIAVDENFELIFSNTGDLIIHDNLEDSVSQNLRQRLRTFRGEWFLNQYIGIPYIEEILVANPNAYLAITIFSEIILGTPGVVTLEKINLNYNTSTRLIELDFKVTLETGQILTLEENI